MECNIVHDTGIVIHCNICIYCVNSTAVRGCIIAVFINKMCCCLRCIFISDNCSAIQRKRAAVNVNTATVTVCFIKAYRTVCKFCTSVCNVNPTAKTCLIKTDYSTVWNDIWASFSCNSAAFILWVVLADICSIFYSERTAVKVDSAAFCCKVTVIWRSCNIWTSVFIRKKFCSNHGSAFQGNLWIFRFKPAANAGILSFSACKAYIL